jgi:hypothetical protein
MSCANVANLGIIGHLKQLEHQQSMRGGNSNLKFTIRKAIKSIRLFPLPILSVDDARLLEGVGDFIATKIARWIDANGSSSSGSSSTSGGCGGGRSEKRAPAQRPPSEASSSTSAAGSDTYVPAFGKGPWFVIISTWLSGADVQGKAVSKAVIMQKMSEAFATMPQVRLGCPAV